jgi:hypothetical protein
MVSNTKRIRPTGNLTPCHTLHKAVAVIAGFAFGLLTNPTAVPFGDGINTVTMAQPVYSIVDQDSAMSGTGPLQPPPKSSRRVRPWERENLIVECQGQHSTDDHDEGRSPRSSPRAGKPSTWRRGAVCRDGGGKGSRWMDRESATDGTDSFIGLSPTATKERDTKATETTMNGFPRGAMSSRQYEANAGESYP